MYYLMPISRSIIRIMMPLTREVLSTEEIYPEDIASVMDDATVATVAAGPGRGSALATD